LRARGRVGEAAARSLAAKAGDRAVFDGSAGDGTARAMGAFSGFVLQVAGSVVAVVE